MPQMPATLLKLACKLPLNSDLEDLMSMCSSVNMTYADAHTRLNN